MKAMTSWELLRTLAESEDCPDGWSAWLEDCAADAQRTAARLQALARAVAGEGQGVGRADYPFIGADVRSV